MDEKITKTCKFIGFPLRLLKFKCPYNLMKFYFYILIFSSYTDEVDMKFFGKAIPRRLMVYRLRQLVNLGLIDMRSEGRSIFIKPRWGENEKEFINRYAEFLNKEGMINSIFINDFIEQDKEYQKAKEREEMRKAEIIRQKQIEAMNKEKDLELLRKKVEQQKRIQENHVVSDLLVVKDNSKKVKEILKEVNINQPNRTYNPNCPICHGLGFFYNKDDLGTYKEFCNCDGQSRVLPND